MEHEIQILSGKVGSDHLHVLISYPPYLNAGKIVQWFKGTSSRVLLQEFAHLWKQLWGRHLWARGYLAVSSGTITDEMIQAYIAEQEGEAIQDDSRFVMDEDKKLPPSRR